MALVAPLDVGQIHSTFLRPQGSQASPFTAWQGGLPAVTQSLHLMRKKSSHKDMLVTRA